MSKPIRHFLSFLLVLQLIIPYSTFAAAVGRFTAVAGKVTQTRAKRVIRPAVKSPIQMKDLIATAISSSATMVFRDDSTITLSENTKLEIKEFLFKDKSRRGIFSMPIGKLTANVKKYIGGDNVFEVQSPTVAVGVRGTGFEFVEAMKDGNEDSNAANQRKATVACTEGSLNLSALSPTGEVVSTAVLDAGQMAVIIGGVITISMIGAATAAAVSRTTDTGVAGSTGGTGTGTSGTTTASGSGVTAAPAAGTAAVATKAGLSTAAIVGIAIGGAAAVGVTAAAIGSSGGGSSSSGGGATAQCNQQQVAGGNTADTRTIELGKTSGTFMFYYNTYTVPDRIVLACYGSGTRLYDTGCYGRSATVSVPFSCSTSIITATVTPNCSYTGNTAWEYTVNCP
jgi:hypothetical protein